jgi:MFS family permease
MTHIPHLIGLAGHALVWGSLLALLVRKFRPNCDFCQKSPALIWILPSLVTLTGLAWFSRGIGSDLSITGMGLGFCWLAHRPIKLPLWLMAGWVLIGLTLYISTMGLISPDFYSAGFAPRGLLLAAVIWIIINGVISPVLGGILALALAAYAGQLMVSVNLWDYLLDPVTWLIMTCRTIAQARSCCRGKHVTVCASGQTLIAITKKA